MPKSAKETGRWPIISHLESVQSAYEEMRWSGETHRLSEMLALRQTPCLMTDNVFLERMHYTQAEQLNGNPVIGEEYKRVAKEANVDITGKVYLSGLAEYPGDPRAWVSGRGDVQRVCEEQGLTCTGAVNVKGRQAERQLGDEQFDIAPDLVEDRVTEKVTKNPALARKNVAELRHETKEEMKPKKRPSLRDL